MSSLLHARGLRAHLSHLLTVFSAGSAVAVSVQACGGMVETAEDAGTVLTTDAGDGAVGRCVLQPIDGGIPPYCTSFSASWSRIATGDCTAADCRAACGVESEGGYPAMCWYDPARTQFTCSWACAVDGRRHVSAIAPPPGDDPADLGGHFARMAYHEAVAVQAFAALRAELRAHGAPTSLLRACRRAELDEVRHVRMASALARRFGATPSQPPAMPAVAARSLAEIALENAREGCGRELLGVFVGEWHAVHAEDPVVRRFYRRIAADEARHAALSLRLQRWLRARLDGSDRARVDAEAMGFLRGAFVDAPPALGVPDGTLLAQVARRLTTDLALAWAA